MFAEWREICSGGGGGGSIGNGLVSREYSPVSRVIRPGGGSSIVAAQTWVLGTDEPCE